MSTDTITPVPTLSTFGWVTTRAQKIDYLLAHFFESDIKQSTLYGKNIASLQGILAENSGDVPAAVNAVENALTKYLGRYYDNVNVNASSQLQNASTSASKMIMVLSIFFTEKGQDYSASFEVTTINGQTQKFTKLNNTA